MRLPLFCRLVLHVLLGSIAGSASAAVCHSVGSASWNGIADAAPWDCPTTGPGDSFEVESGHTITITAPIQWTQVTPVASPGRGPSLTVRDGGRLVCRLADGCTGIDWDGGLIVEGSGQLTARGRYLDLDRAIPGLVDTAAEAGLLPAGDVVPCPVWNFSGFVSDCALGDPNHVALVYPHAEATASILASVAAIQPGDTWIWVDPDISDPDDAPVDENFPYEVVFADADFAGAGTHAVVVLDVRQTDPNDPIDNDGPEAHYPTSLRQIRQATVDPGAPTTQGSLDGRPFLLFVDPAVLPRIAVYSKPGDPADGWVREELVGRFVRPFCGAGIPCPYAWRIVRTYDALADGLSPYGDCPGGSGTCDALEVYTPFGLDRAVAPGDSLLVDYGFAPGDLALVRRDVRLRDAGPSQAAPPGRHRLDLSSLTGDDRLDLRAVIVEDTAIELDRTDGAGSSFVDVWVRDPYHGTGNSIFSMQDADDWHWERVSVSLNLRPGVAITRPHGVTWGSGPDAGEITGWQVDQLGWRYVADDWISCGGNGGVTGSEITGRRVRFQWASDLSSSQQFASDNSTCPRNFDAHWIDAECVQCSTPAAGVLGNRIGRYEGLLVIASSGHIGPGAGALAGVETMQDVMVLGSTYSAPNAPVDHFVYAHIDGCGGGQQHAFFGQLNDVEQRNGLVRDSLLRRGFYRTESATSESPGMVGDAVFENVLFLDTGDIDEAPGCPGAPDYGTRNPPIDACPVGVIPPDRPAQCEGLRINPRIGTDAGIQWRNVTMAQRPRSPISFASMLFSNDASAPYSQIDGFLFWKPSPPLGTTSQTPGQEWPIYCPTGARCAQILALQQEPHCFASSFEAIEGGGHEGLYPSETVSGEPLDLAGPARGDFTPLAGGRADGAGCGIEGGSEAPGIADWRPMHRWLRQAPETASRPHEAWLDSDGDGMRDVFEVRYGFDRLLGDEEPDGIPDGMQDPDADGLGNEDEDRHGTDPRVADSDGDGLLDGFEVAGGLDPLHDGTGDARQGALGDGDADGLDNLAEQQAGTAPDDPDTDGDGYDDGEEAAAGTDGSNPFSHPMPGRLPVLGGVGLATLATLLAGLGAAVSYGGVRRR